MSRDHWEIVQRLATAQERTREAYEETYKGRDLHPGTEIAGAWPFITAAYSGIEQTFKFLIAAARGQTVEELVATHGPKGSKGKAQQPYRHHHLGQLHESLEEPIQAELAEQYRRFRTLHPYIGPATAADFLNAVSAEKGRGYELWRYSLTAPETKLPQNSVAALLWIWDVGVQLCERDRDGWVLTGVYEQLCQGLAWSLEEIMDKRHMERIGEGQANDDVGREATEWIEAHGGPVNAYATLTHRAHRGLFPEAGSEGLSESLAASLKAWVQKDHGDRVKPKSDVRVFVDRATGYRGPGRGVRWNHQRNGFEDLPWELAEMTAEAPPQGSYRFEQDARGRRRLQEARWVFKQGFQVRENYPATDEMPADKWLCTLCGEKEVGPEDKLTVRFWEHADERLGFHVEVAGAEDCREGRLVREVVRLDSESTRAKGARIVQSPADESGE